MKRISDLVAEICGISNVYEKSTNSIDLLNRHIADNTGGAVPFADLIPYSFFDEKNEIFINEDGTMGFWFEINPIVGSDEAIEKNLTLFFNDELEDDSYLQFLIVAGHDISEVIGLWESKRESLNKAVYHITNYRKRFIENLACDFENAGDGRLARNFRIFVTYSSGCTLGKKDLLRVIKFRKKLFNKLKAEKLSPRVMNAEDLIVVGRDIIYMSLHEKKSSKKYSPYNNISHQICIPLTEMHVAKDRISYIDSDLESRIFYPKELPEHFALARMIALLGSETKAIPARFVISYSIAANLGASGSSKIIAQGYRSIHAAEKEYTRNDIGAKEDAREWRNVININKKGERFLSECMLVQITTSASNMDIAEETLKSIWNAEDWKLRNNKGLQLVSAIGILPMLQASMWKSMAFFKLTKNALSGEVVAKLPIQGEWKGVPVSGVLMMGRRGQLFNFNPYYRIGGGGNYNISMMAPSGSGKSFFLQELATSMIAQDVAVFIMDIGASYKNLCHLFKGEMVRFNSDSVISLNPFTAMSDSGASYVKALELLKQNVDINDIIDITGLSIDKIDALVFSDVDELEDKYDKDSIEILEIKDESLGKSYFIAKDSVIYAKSMIASMCRVSGKIRDEAIIERAISIGIIKYGVALDITKLAKVLSTLKDKQGRDIDGASNLADSLYPYTEDGIHGRFFKAGLCASFDSNLTVFELEELVNDESLLAVVLQVILMQITMQFLCGDRSKKFMLIVDEAWMIMDFAVNFLERFARTVRKYGGSLVVCTQDLSSFQKGPSHAAILESSTWKLILQQKEEGVATFAKDGGYSEYIDLIRSIRKCSDNKFSEILFDTNGVKVIGRLVTDPYSTAVYSTEADDFAFLLAEERNGVDKHEAIIKLSKKYGDSINDISS